MNKEILKFSIENGFLLDKDILNFLQDLDDTELAKQILDKVSHLAKKKVITKTLIEENPQIYQSIFTEVNGEKKKIVERYFVKVSLSVEVTKEREISSIPNVNSSVKILSSPILASQKLETKDFIRHFRNRYSFYKNLLQSREELKFLTSIDKIGNNNEFSIIGMVLEKRITKNKNVILEVEDLTGRIKVLINQNREEVYEKSKEILVDDVIALKCSGSRDFVYVNDLFFPDAFCSEKKRFNDEEYILFTSDIHIGSGNFLENNFEKFIKWLDEKDNSPEQKEFIKKIKYLFIVGDSVDGVGIYPGQEKDLKIKDMKKQYDFLASYLKRIPQHIQIIICPGQHDAVRVAEPQPPIGPDFAEALHELPNIYFVSNPSFIEVGGNDLREGFKILMYHGASMHGVINEIEELRVNNAHSNPTRVVKYLLRKRHLAPSHGVTTYLPNADRDPMIIREVPDIVLTGDLHKTDISSYNGVLLFASSCWQSMTAFEEKVGNKPDPCKVPMLNLKTREIKILDFSDLPEEKNGN